MLEGPGLPPWGRGRGLVEKPRPGLPPCSCLCPSTRCPLPSPVISLEQFAVCPSHLADMSCTGCPPHPRPAHHLSMFLAHVKAHEQGPYNHHDDKDHHHDHDEKAFEVHRAAGDPEPALGGC